MALFNMEEEVQKVESRINTLEEVLGKGLLQPFSNTNSGSRKLMFSVNVEQRLPIMEPEVPLIGTGHEMEFGKYSSSFITSDDNYEVFAKIPKFSFNPDYDYLLILINYNDKTLNMIERVPYKHITESYGYLFDNSYLDRLAVNGVIKKGDCLQKSTSFDEFNNRMDGLNLITAYMSCEYTIEDGIIVSESAAKKMTSPLIKPVSILLNDNDIPLNLYGGQDIYKSFPNIGEHVKDHIVCAVRRERKEQALYSQAYNRLSSILTSDEKYIINGEVLDIDVLCNNTDSLQSFYNSQIDYYSKEKLRYYETIVQYISPLLVGGYSMSYELQKLYYTAKRLLEGDKYINDKVFSGTVLNITVLEKKPVTVGDKITNRYGGKGVVSLILPDELMPLNDLGQRVEIICNPSGIYNRENPGQLFEISLNHISDRILQFARSGLLDMPMIIDMIHSYLSIISKPMGDHFIEYIETFKDDEESLFFINDMIQEAGLYLSILPMSESMDIDKLLEIYEKFNFVKLNEIMVPIKDSNGNYRMIKARRPIVTSKIYYYRLKQYAEEKFSATSMSSTNIRNENSRNKANRSFKAMYTKTPIRFGEMETGNFSHLGMEQTIINLMLYSTSPHGRRLAESLITGDPFDVNIKLDMGAKNRSAEIVQTYLKTIGLKLIFNKIRKDPIIPAHILPAAIRDKNNPIIPAIVKTEPIRPGYILPATIRENVSFEVVIPDEYINKKPIKGKSKK